ncbi:MAG: ATP-dependent sacrificial sulfur transferase LarE [Firmicutes bacterium]|nr:ATP-dependent sacrificial sulfur transferase LarE [Bacillota bacterium]
MNKREKLSDNLAAFVNEDCAVAFSGGVDSSLLLRLVCDAAKKTGVKVYAITMDTNLHPKGDIKIAEKMAKEAGAEHIVIRVDELNEAEIEGNPKDRCYKCKSFLFGRLKQEAAHLGAKAVLEGTNADDLKVYRPGIKALKELGIKSPLADAGMMKEEIRSVAEEIGISAASRPSAPCLATRFPYGTRLSYDELRRVEEGEEYIRSLGFYNVRLRVHGDIARIEVDKEDLTKLAALANDISERLKQLGYVYVTADLSGFKSGSMDIDKK